ncbi:glucodextranase DOMON-like domain-containing protein [Phosphitispora sp. TUW77]|uniref:glucodextranase DOMON-like domain-containing protein n=1 Tax=Phosphitispora sp. TUW77 TaxID=3152361 RepID=UPI003AB1C03A
MSGGKRRILVIIGAILLFVVLACLGIAAFTVGQAKKQFNRERVIFVLEDPAGDDYGPGTYKYPTDSIFDPKKEHFDLQKFSVSTIRDLYHFDLVFPRVTNPWGASEGFSHTMAQIYISDDPDNGRIETFKEGANVIFDPHHPWQYFIKAVSFNKTAVYHAGDYAGAGGRNSGVKAKLQPDGRTVRVTVPKGLLPGDPYNWRYYVIIGSQDGLGPDNFRKVNTTVERWVFGGGTDTDYDPNIIDLLAYPGKQEKLLGSYDASRRQQAVIESVGPSKITPTRWEKMLDKVIVFMQRMKVKL